MAAPNRKQEKLLTELEEKLEQLPRLRETLAKFSKSTEAAIRKEKPAREKVDGKVDSLQHLRERMDISGFHEFRESVFVGGSGVPPIPPADSRRRVQRMQERLQSRKDGLQRSIRSLTAQQSKMARKKMDEALAREEYWKCINEMVTAYNKVAVPILPAGATDKRTFAYMNKFYQLYDRLRAEPDFVSTKFKTDAQAKETRREPRGRAMQGVRR